MIEGWNNQIKQPTQNWNIVGGSSLWVNFTMRIHFRSLVRWDLEDSGLRASNQEKKEKRYIDISSALYFAFLLSLHFAKWKSSREKFSPTHICPCFRQISIPTNKEKMSLIVTNNSKNRTRQIRHFPIDQSHQSEMLPRKWTSQASAFPKHHYPSCICSFAPFLWASCI